jgi:hypothetical protein
VPPVAPPSVGLAERFNCACAPLLFLVGCVCLTVLGASATGGGGGGGAGGGGGGGMLGDDMHMVSLLLKCFLEAVRYKFV